MPGTGMGVGLGIPGGNKWSPLQLGSDLKLWLRPESLSNPNRLTYTEDFSNAAWTKTTTTVTSGQTDPDGGSTAFKLVDGGAGGSVSQSAVGFQASGADIGNLWYKKVSGGNGTLRIQDGTDNTDVALSASTWTQVSRTHTLNAAATKSEMVIILAATSEIHVWHPQLEAGSTATPYKANVATAGGIVSQWDDSAGVNHATQGTQASMPLVVAGALDNKSGVLFDGVDDSLALTTELSAAGAFELWIVLDRNTAAASHYLFNGADNTLEYIILNNASPSVVVTSTPSDAGNVVSSASVDVGSPVILRIARDGSDNMVAFENAVDITTGSPTMTATEYFSLIGKRSNNSGYFDGKMYEIVLTTSALSSQEVSNMNAYLAREYPSV